MSEPLSARDRLSLPSALLKVQVEHPMDVLVVIDAAMTLLDRARLAIVAEGSGRAPALPKPAPLALPKPEKTRKTKAGKPRRPAKAKPAVIDAEPVTANGVTVQGNVVSFNGKSITVTPKQAQLAVALAKVMPSVADRDRLIRAIWNRTDDIAEVLLGQTSRALNLAVEAIGLKVTNVRGVGVVMAGA